MGPGSDREPRGEGAQPAPIAEPAVAAFCRRHFVTLAATVLALAAFNLFFRIGDEVVREWDESLYAVSALETARHHTWIGVTFRGAIDYYNSKPPLNVWLVALSFKAFGVGLVPLRLVSTVSAWLTIAVLLAWTRRALGPVVALCSALVLSTTFAFFYVHSGRTANTDPLFTLLVLLTVVVLWASSDQPRRLAWTGPIAAAAFMLRGMGVVMPVAIVAVHELLRRRRSLARLAPMVAGVAVGAVPVLAWAYARWRFDQWQFFARMWHHDFVARTVSDLEGHPGGPFYFVGILLKYEYDWLVAALLAWVLVPIPWARLRAWLRSWRGDPLAVSTVAWGAVTLLLPSAMQTKASWYLNPFYPLFALGVGVVLAHALEGSVQAPSRHRFVALVSVLAIVFLVAEGRLWWNSYRLRDLWRSEQGLMVSARADLRGRQVFRDRWPHDLYFVADGLVGAVPREAADAQAFLRDSRPGDFLLAMQPVDAAAVSVAGSNGRQWLLRRDR